jgi:predicted nucleic acid-binding protein
VKRYLLDSGPLAAYLAGRSGIVELISPWIRRREAATSILVYGEVLEYLKGRHDFARRKSELHRLLSTIYPSTLSLAALEHYADIRRRLRPPKGPGLISDMDTVIAATALERDLTLVTTDSDFDRVPGLWLLLLPRRDLS